MVERFVKQMSRYVIDDDEAHIEMIEDPDKLHYLSNQNKAITALNVLIIDEQAKYDREVELGVTKKIDLKEQQEMLQ